MIVLLPLIALLAGRPQTPAPLHCRIELGPGKKSERCHVTAPAARPVRACADADRRAGHCAASGVARGRFVAWVVSTGPGRCRITDKGTKWKKGTVRAKLTGDGVRPAICDLYVEVE
jgi:hypothetical protein